MLADANQVVALEIANGHMAETATELHKLEHQNPNRSPLILVYRGVWGLGDWEWDILDLPPSKDSHRHLRASSQTERN